MCIYMYWCSTIICIKCVYWSKYGTYSSLFEWVDFSVHALHKCWNKCCDNSTKYDILWRGITTIKSGNKYVVVLWILQCLCSLVVIRWKCWDIGLKWHYFRFQTRNLVHFHFVLSMLVSVYIYIIIPELYQYMYNCCIAEGKNNIH